MRKGSAVPARVGRARRRAGIALAVLATTAAVLPAAAAAQVEAPDDLPAALPSPSDPRVGLSAGLDNAGTAALGMELQAHLNKPPGWFNPANPGDFAFPNSDLAFQGDFAFVGGFNGFQVYDISNPAAPSLRTAVVCPGGQGDVSVYENLLFMSVEETRAKKDCTASTPESPTTPENRFRGVRIFDIGNIDAPVQVGQVQTCRGSHTHTLVTDDEDPDNVYIYVQGTGGVRSAAELAGCVETPGGNAALEVETPQAENSSRWRIEVIKVPVDAPETAAVVNGPRLFSDGTRINGLQNTPRTPNHPSGIPWSPRPVTDACHDITVYPALDLAAGACEGNGLLIDISDPANPQRISAISDKRFAYWHGATFSNDGKTVVFTDEWGGGTAARCRAADDLKWGANGVYDIVDGKLEWRSYFKIPPVQTTAENCVSHLPSLVPVPGRDILVQAWSQGGASLIDFSDSESPEEIGYFDRGPINAANLVLGGFWSTYWYNGAAYGSEIARGFDVLGLTPTDQLSDNEIAAAQEAQVDRLNVQHQDPLTWEPSFNVVRAHIDQAVRAGDLTGKQLDQVDKFVDRAERFNSGHQQAAASAQLMAISNQLPGEQFDTLRGALLALSDAV
jgi:hypothetical protein